MNIINGKEENKIVAKEQKLKSGKLKKKIKQEQIDTKNTPHNCCISCIFQLFTMTGQRAKYRLVTYGVLCFCCFSENSLKSMVSVS